ncbi:MAG: hypothetical protein C5B49_13495 [Bdellovibrio sp.]|nr:MAG: hypothetical protein C5B49_13495 [Bdellovibrio sp.]
MTPSEDHLIIAFVCYEVEIDHVIKVESFRGLNLLRGGKMSESELDSIRRSLILQKSRILNKAVEFRAREMSGFETTADEAEKISNELSMTVSIRLQEHDRSALVQIERALGKIHDGTYGLCERCKSPIGIRRLRARPFAGLCIACMEEQEELNSVN